MRVRQDRVLGLRTLVTTPDDRRGPPRAHLVIRTPYDAAALLPEAAGWAGLGIGTVLQDVRGRYGSPGVFEPFRHEAEDGAALLTWARGRIGGPLVLYGPSYAAHCALAAHVHVPGDALALLVPACGLAETARTVDGAFELAHRIGWWTTHVRGRRSRTLRPPDLERLAAQPLDVVGDLLDPPIPRWREIVGVRRDPVGRRRWLATAPPVPLLVIGGSRDWFAADAADLAAAWPGPARLVIGPWAHDLRGARRAAVLDAWLGHVLGGEPPHDRLVRDAVGRAVPPGAEDVDPPAVGPPLRHPATRPATVTFGGPSLVLPCETHGPLVADLTVRIDAEPDDAEWVVDLVRRDRDAPGGATGVAHAAGPGTRLRLGPVVETGTDDGLALVVSAGAVPRHPRPPDAGRPRRVRGVTLERTHR